MQYKTSTTTERCFTCDNETEFTQTYAVTAAGNILIELTCNTCDVTDSFPLDLED